MLANFLLLMRHRIIAVGNGPLSFTAWPSMADSHATIALILIFGVSWISHLMSVALTVPMDNIEQLVWSRSLEWGYYKHPPLPTWLLSVPLRWSGPSAMVTAILGAVCTLTSLLIFTRLVQSIWGHRTGWLALLAALCITFYNGRLNYYNHNTTLMLCVSLSALCWWQILQTGRTRWWIGLGISAGLGMLSKYQYALVVIPSLFLIWQSRVWRDPQQLRALGWAVLTASLIFLPHLLWLLQQDLSDSPIRYALQTSLPSNPDIPTPNQQRLRSGIWLLDLLFNRCLPALIFLAGIKLLSQRETREQPKAKETGDTRRISGTTFLLAWGALPVLCITFLGLSLGMDLQMQWGTAFAIWCIPHFMWALGLNRAELPASRTVWALCFFAVLQVGLMIQSYETSAKGCCAKPSRWRTFDSQTLARELDDSARSAVGGHFSIISGPSTVAGAIALHLPEHPKVLINHNLRISPWVKEHELLESGVVEIWPPETGPHELTRLPSGWGWRLPPTEPVFP